MVIFPESTKMETQTAALHRRVSETVALSDSHDLDRADVDVGVVNLSGSTVVLSGPELPRTTVPNDSKVMVGFDATFTTALAWSLTVTSFSVASARRLSSDPWRGRVVQPTLHPTPSSLNSPLWVKW